MLQNAAVFNRYPGGFSSAYVVAAQVVKAAPGTLCRIVVVAPGTGGALTVNDCLTVGAAAADNAILSVPFGSLTGGQIFTLLWPCLVGIVVSALPSGGGAVSISYG